MSSLATEGGDAPWAKCSPPSYPTTTLLFGGRLHELSPVYSKKTALHASDQGPGYHCCFFQYCSSYQAIRPTPCFTFTPARASSAVRPARTGPEHNEAAQVVQTRGYSRMFRAEGLLIDRQSAFIERLRLSEAQREGRWKIQPPNITEIGFGRKVKLYRPVPEITPPKSRVLSLRGAKRRGNLVTSSGTSHILLDRGRERPMALPALRTVRAVLPHTALQSVVSTS